MPTIMKHLIPALLLLLPGCLVDRKLGAFESGEADAGDDGAPADDGGFDPFADSGSPVVGDIGDGTLDDDMLWVIQTPDGPLYLFGLTQRLGDSFQAWLQATTFNGATWVPAGPETRDSSSGGPFDDNDVRGAWEDLFLPAGTHPWGNEDLNIDFTFNARLHADELICGRINIDFEGGEDLPGLTFVAVPADELDADPMPNPPCA